MGLFISLAKPYHRAKIDTDDDIIGTTIYILSIRIKYQLPSSIDYMCTMISDTSLDTNDSLISAMSPDSSWMANIPIPSTHFMMSDVDGTIVPNISKECCTINLLDMINNDLVNNNGILLHKESLEYPCYAKGSKALIELEGFVGDDDETITRLRTYITNIARENSTVLKSDKRRDKRE